MLFIIRNKSLSFFCELLLVLVTRISCSIQLQVCETSTEIFCQGTFSTAGALTRISNCTVVIVQFEKVARALSCRIDPLRFAIFLSPDS